MITADATPEAVVARLAPHARTFHDCLREAVRRARAQFEEQDGVRPPGEPWLFAHYVRWQLKWLLRDALPPGTPVVVE